MGGLNMTSHENSSTWKKVILSDCCDEIGKRTDNPANSGYERFVGLEHLESGETSVRQWGSTEDVTSSMKIFKVGDVIFARRNVYLRRAARVNFDGVCSGDGIVLRAKEDLCLPDLLPFILNTETFWDYVSSQADGTMSKRITVKRLMAYEFALPPLEEQRRIAEVLQAIETTNSKLLKVVASGDIALRSYRDTWFGISNSSTSTLGKLCEKGSGIQIGPFGAQLHQADYTQEGVPVVMPSDLGDNSISLDRISKVSPDKAEQLSQHRLQIGDIVLPRRGDLDRRALVSNEHEGWLCGTGCLRIRLDDISLSEAVVQSLSSVSVLRWLKSRAVGTTMPNLNSKIVSGVPVHILKNVGDALDIINQMRAAIVSTHERIMKLRCMRSTLLSEAIQ